MIKNHWLTITLLLFCLFANGTTIHATLTDSKTQTPIPYANVFLNKYAGTVSDLKGEFILNIKEFKPNDTLFISCIGYKRKTIVLRDLNSNGMNKIELYPVVYTINPLEISTSGITAYELLQDAFHTIKPNCKTDKHYYKGSYFEQIKNYDKIQQWHTRSVSSAIIIEDPGYDKLHTILFDNILENIYILGIQKNKDSLNYAVIIAEANYLKWTLERNYCRYKSDYFSSPNTYNYNLEQSYYDSTLNTNILEIKITPKNPKKMWFMERYI